MRRLFALSSTVHVESYIKLSLAASGADRNCVHMAWCPRPGEHGTIVPGTKGEPAVMHDAESSFDIHWLMAWDPRAEFCFSDLLGLPGIVMTQPHVSTRWSYEEDAVLLHADDSVDKPGIRKLLASIASIVVPRF